MLPSVLLHPSVWLQSYYSGLHIAISLFTTQQEVAEPAAGLAPVHTFCRHLQWNNLLPSLLAQPDRRLQGHLLAPAYASENGWPNQLCLRTALSCTSLCRQPITKPEGWLLWAVLGVVLAPFVVGLTVTAVSATGYDVSGAIALSMPIQAADAASTSLE